MKTIRSPSAMTTWSDQLSRGVVIGLVPTMGALHDGHQALIRTGRRQCDALVVSIFVNPTQFAPTEDLASYPRPIEGKIESYAGRKASMSVSSLQLARCIWEFPDACDGAGHRTSVGRAIPPHHFAGVATVVTKLFNVVRPGLAFFGQKDYQQCGVVRQLVKDLNFPIRIVVCPTVREQDGLAMSSRNVFLSTEGRRIAPIFFHALQAGRQAIENGLSEAASVEALMRKVIGAEPPFGSIIWLFVIQRRWSLSSTSIARRSFLVRSALGPYASSTTCMRGVHG